MYVGFVVLVLLVLPLGCVLVELLWLHGSADVMAVVGKWFVFWAVGVRLSMAGLRQVMQPQFTSESIFNVKDRASFAIVREVGFANMAMGTLGLVSLAVSGWVVPAAIVGGLYYGLAGAGHLARGNWNYKEQTALISDFSIFVVLGAFVASRRF